MGRQMKSPAALADRANSPDPIGSGSVADLDLLGHPVMVNPMRDQLGPAVMPTILDDHGFGLRWSDRGRGCNQCQN